MVESCADGSSFNSDRPTTLIWIHCNFLIFRIYTCRTRFCLLLYSTAVINLYCSHLFSLSLSFPTFHRVKSSKSARHAESPVWRFFVQELQATSFSQTVIATWTFLLIFGWCGPSSVSHSLISEHLTSGRTYLSLNPKINRLQVVSFNGAGVSMISPLYK